MSTPVLRPNPLTNLRQQVEEHWKKHRPEMYLSLKKSGQLSLALQEATEQTKNAYHDAMDKGMSSDQAWELVREEWALLPESQSPDLPFDLTSQ